jgi:hypothetical protein
MSGQEFSRLESERLILRSFRSVRLEPGVQKRCRSHTKK